MRGLLPVLLLPVLLLAVGASGCTGKERDALLAFKAGLKDPHGRLASWSGGPNCCRWYSVTCSNKTGRVVKLDLYNEYNPEFALSGAINPSLLSLAHLEYIDLGWNDFYGESIPSFIGSLKNLRHLDLSHAGFRGEIPPLLGNLSRLSYLAMDYFYTDASVCVSAANLHWLSRLSSLKYLDLSGCNLSAASGWLKSVSMLSSLQVLILEGASLPPTDLNSLSLANFTHLVEIDISSNIISSSFPYWLTNLRALSYVRLGGCGLHGRIPESLGNLTSLNFLDLSSNNLVGEIPGSIGALCNLNYLDLSPNNLTGDVANVGKAMARCMNQLDVVNFRFNRLTGRLSGWFESFTDVQAATQLSNDSLAASLAHSNNSGNLSHLRVLCLSGNSLYGTLTEQHLANLPNLEILLLSCKSLRIAVDINWVPPFQLCALQLRSCQLESQFPRWLRTQTRIDAIDLPNAGIVGPIPDWLWTLSTSLGYLGLSNNVLTGKLPASLVHLRDLYYLVLNSNRLEGQIPDMPDNIGVIYLSNNSFSGSLPHRLGRSSYMKYILLSSNHLNGSIPRYFCDLTELSVIDVSNNSLSGGLPDCWKHNSRINVLDFSSNNLEGEIPPSIGSLTLLRWLHLNKNKLSGVLPTSLQSCKALTFLDIGENHFTGSVPAWIGKGLKSLAILRLRSNQLSGNIPSDLSQLQRLQVLDLGNNKLSGTLPHFLGNFTAMASQQSLQLGLALFYGGLTGSNVSYFSSLLYLTTKGEERMYSTNLYLMNSIDLSDNELTGGIPTEIGSLLALKSLNLSINHLSGSIPETIGGMHQLESLDLSWNHLSGVIPQTLASLDSLGSLNLSYNNLSGKIPSGSQLQTLGDQDPYIYAGNKYLCSPIASESCYEDKGNPLDRGESKDGRDIWLYVLSGLGFGFGFAAVWWLLVFSKATSKVYFQLIDSTYEKIYDWVVLWKIKVNMKLVEKKSGLERLN